MRDVILTSGAGCGTGEELVHPWKHLCSARTETKSGHTFISHRGRCMSFKLCRPHHSQTLNCTTPRQIRKEALLLKPLPTDIHINNSNSNLRSSREHCFSPLNGIQEHGRLISKLGVKLTYNLLVFIYTLWRREFNSRAPKNNSYQETR